MVQCGSMNQDSVPFHGCAVSQCKDIPPFVYPVTCLWKFGLFPLLPTKNNTAMSICLQVFVWMSFHFSWVDT